ncbi:Tim44 domain-containing protein [Piscirickettsia litoralis]|uniref:Tim44-like domain-containing protein n=1 Tax=Piscirickettsia litoralis TaxID=1891921 RepID=A0ABX3A316_9GAMM|nr:hypothetical protein [Piscirickettsia litoralis]ODN43261.1 hypothetical protein BGC07_10455 [Piscirickettsia litoralis]
MGSVLLWIVILGGIIFLLNKFFMSKQDKYSNTQRPPHRPVEDNPPAGNVYDHKPEEPVAPPVDQGALANEAKELFVTLQDAWNNEKLAVLQKRTSAEVFTKVQSSERHQTVSIVALNAEVQEVKKSSSGSLKAKVIYSGKLRQGNGQPYDFREVWQLSREDQAGAVLKVEGISE